MGTLRAQEIPDEDLLTLGRLAGEAVREENRRLRAAGNLPATAEPSVRIEPVEDALAR